MPGANERALEKAKDIPADALILDLEDAVAPDAKPEARERVCAAVTGGGYGNRELAIRANGIGTPWHDDDLKAIAAAGPGRRASCPKVNTRRRGAASSWPPSRRPARPDHTKLWAMLETPQAMLHAEEIAGASERLTVLVMGTNDLAKELHAARVPGPPPAAARRSACACSAARATGKVLLDGVYNDIKDEAGFLAECRQGREMGFDGKTLIHPQPGRAVQRRVRPAATTRSSWPAASSPPSRRPRPRAAAS